MPRRGPKQKPTQSFTVEATIGELAPGGEGVALVELNGERRAVFVPAAAIGDRMTIDIDVSQRPARALHFTLHEPGAERITPACSVAGVCGGCDWMHLSAASQREAHLDHVRRAIPDSQKAIAIGWHAAPTRLGYRTRARFHAVAARQPNRRAILGIHARATHKPTEVDQCRAVHPAIDAGRRDLEEWLSSCTGSGEAQIALGDPRREPRPITLDLTWKGELAPSFFAALEKGIASGEWAGMGILESNASRPAVVGDPTPWIDGADGQPLRLASGGFAQANEEMNPLLVARVVELASACDFSAGRVVELYAGAGNFTIALARLTERITAVESDSAACEALRANVGARKQNVKVTQADANTYDIGLHVRLVVLDPPRAGAKQAIAQVIAKKTRHLVYVSCDPTTLGRDLNLLAQSGYRITHVDAFEMFPETSHIETVVALERG